MASEYKLRLFFSVDLAGSTAYKAKSIEQKDDFEWCLTFQNFFIDFPSSFYSNCENKSLATPSFWKILGDEILFYTEIDTHLKVFEYIYAFKNAISYYNKSLNEKEQNNISCKGTVWLAGFPVSNIEINIPLKSKKIKDFIGPSIDTGFRVAKFSTKRKFCLSVETALVLCDILSSVSHEDFNGKYEEEDFKIPIRFEGKQLLKGVLNNTPYPIFWIDMSTDNNTEISNDHLEDQWSGRGDDCKYTDVVSYCENYIDKHNDYIFMPFIDSEKENKYDKKPPDFDKRKQQALQQRDETSENEAEDLEEPKKIPPSKIDSIINVLFEETAPNNERRGNL